MFNFVCTKLELCCPLAQQISFGECPLYLGRKINMVAFDNCCNRGTQGATAVCEKLPNLSG